MKIVTQWQGYSSGSLDSINKVLRSPGTSGKRNLCAQGFYVHKALTTLQWVNSGSRQTQLPKWQRQ